MTSATVLFANVLRSMSESLELRCTSWITYNLNVVDILDNKYLSKGEGQRMVCHIIDSIDL